MKCETCKSTKDLVLFAHNWTNRGEVKRYKCRECRNKRMREYLRRKKWQS